MVEKTDKSVMSKMEASEYLGISLYRLNQLIDDDVLVPVNSESSKTPLFSKSELDKIK